MIVKKCGKCGKEKPLSDFWKQKRGKFGVEGRCKKCRKEYRQENEERLKQRRKQYYQENKERIKQYHQENKERIKQYKQENKERANQRRRQHYKENKERFLELHKQRRQSDPVFKLKINLRTRTSQAFRDKGFSKKSKTKEMLGVEWEIVKKHIERQFTKGMNWDNYGEWHIDHIIPLSSAKTEEEVVKLCHYSNLQPLWAEDNFSKSDSIEATQVKLRL